MNDQRLRRAVKRKLLARYVQSSMSVVLEELGLHHGEVRADIVVVNDMLHGFELKSDCDSLERLPEQSRIYSSVFDRVTLIVGYRHAYNALEIVPEWWGVKLAREGPRRGIHFSDARGPRKNPSLHILAVAELLWREEALALLDEVDTAQGFRSKPRAAIYSRLVETADINLIRSRVRRQLKRRTNWRFDGLRTSNGD